MAETAEERRRRLTNEMMKGTGVTADDLSEWLAYTDEEVKGKSKSDKKKEAQKKRIQKQRLASIEKGKKAAQKLAPDLVESTKKKRESWILPEGEEMTWKPTPDQLRAMEKKDREVAKYAPQFKKAVEESEETGVLGSRDHSLKYRGEAPKRDTGSPSFYPSDPGAREKISNQTFRKAAGDRIKRLRHERAIMQSRPRLEEGNERWHKRPDSEEIHERYMDMAGTEKQLGDEEMPGLMNLYETDRDSRIKRAAEYKQFSDDAKLSALERARRGELPIRQGEGSEDAMREALPVIRGREREKMEALRRKYDRGAVGGGEAIDLSDPKYSGKRIYGGPHVGTDIEEKLSGRPLRGAEMEKYVGKKLDLNDPDNRDLLRKIAPEKAASLEQGDIEQQMMQNMAQDEEERAVNEEFTVQQNMQNMTEDEQNEVIQTVQDQMGPQSEQAIAAKEATGRYVRYEGAGTGEGGFVINKRELDNLFDRKEKMNLLQNIPQEDRAALLHKWKLIDDEDFNLTQKKSAKELLELEKLKLQIADLKSKSSTEKMSDSDKAQFNAAASGFQDAVKSRRWDEAQAYSDTLESILPGSQKNFNVDNVQKAIDDRLKKLPPLQKAKSQMGKEVFNGYFSFRNKLVEKIDLVKRSGDSKALDQLLGTTIDTGDNKGKTWSDILEGQGIPSWQTIEGMAAGDKPEIALAITNGKSNNISEISRQQYMGYVLPRIRDKIMKGNYGKWHDMIEGGLRTAQDNKTKELQEKVNNPEKSNPLKEVEREPDDKLSKMKKNLTEEEEVELEDEAVFLKENDPYGLYEGPLGNARLRNKLVEMLQRKKDREANQKGSIRKTKRQGSRSIKVR